MAGTTIPSFAQAHYGATHRYRKTGDEEGFHIDLHYSFLLALAEIAKKKYPSLKHLPSVVSGSQHLIKAAIRSKAYNVLDPSDVEEDDHHLFDKFKTAVRQELHRNTQTFKPLDDLLTVVDREIIQKRLHL